MNQQSQKKWYRTLVRGRLVQRSGLTVGGASDDPVGSDTQCHRDGQGRLTIPGTSLAGALVETAARICPALVSPRGRGSLYKSYSDRELDRLSGKSSSNKPKLEVRHEGEAELYQSLLQVYPCHLADRPPVEQRQGVGIRQKTGATAIDQRALFDQEVIPPGTAWDFLVEIDTCRAGPRAESLVLLALYEWTQARCWLGASVARGTGWLALEQMEVLRLPLNKDAVDQWPTNEVDSIRDLWKVAAAVKDAERKTNIAEIHKQASDAFGPQLPGDRFWYLTFDVQFRAGPRENGFGLEAFSIGGHNGQPAVLLSNRLLAPHGMNKNRFREQYDPDMPVVTVRRQTPVAPADDANTPSTGTDAPPGTDEPFIPGSSVRGPLRHATSRRRRGLHGEIIPDPNERGSVRESKDSVSQLFGLVEHSARLLVRDALLTDQSRDQYRLALFQHHAEDEFAGGVYGTTKHDRTAVVDGQFDLQLVIEARSAKELCGFAETLYPTLKLAKLGHLALGRGKRGGLGWIPWRFSNISLARAGDPNGTGIGESSEADSQMAKQLLEALSQLLEEESSHV